MSPTVPKNRLVSVVSNGETTSYSYDANGNLISESTQGKASASYSYNKANQLTSLTNSAAGKTVANYSVSYYLDGNKSAIAEAGQPTVSYVYDGLGQLISETTEGVSTTIYAYDPRQNRTSKTLKNERQVIESVSNYTYDLNNRLLQEVETVKEIQNTTDYYYDNNGNQITKLHSVIEPDFLAYNKLGIEEANPMAEFYSYDALNRLESSVVNGKTTTYTYDGNNLRQTKTTDGITTKHIYDGINVVSDTVGTTRNIYVRGLSLISGTINGTKSYYHKNTHGDVISLTDETGAVTTDYRYDAFGNQESVTETDANPFRYCGEYFDTETNNIYLRNRYYDTVTGRFITEDPIHDGLNWYVYCGNNPVMFIDPNGLENETDADEFGKHSVVYKRLKELGDAYRATDSIYLRSNYHKEAELIRQLERARVSHGLQKYPLGYKYNTVDVVDKIKEYDYQIANTSLGLGVPKSMISSILYREMMCFKIDDNFDSTKASIKGDASLGLGQIFIKTAQNAEEYYYGQVQYDSKAMKKRLLDEERNIYYIGLVLKHAGSMVGMEFDIDYKYKNVNKIFARYNGTNDAAAQYGRETSEYLSIFISYYGG